MTQQYHETATDDAIIAQALHILEQRARYAENISLSSPDDARDYCRLRLAGLPHEVFGVLWLDAQNLIFARRIEIQSIALTDGECYGNDHYGPPIPSL